MTKHRWHSSLGKFTKASLTSDINVTPLVDVCLVLLIIFMVITPVVQMGYLVKVPPKAPAGLPPSAVNDQIILRLMPDNRILINKDDVPLEQFPQRIRDLMHGNTSKMIFFAASGTHWWSRWNVQKFFIRMNGQWPFK